MKDLKEYIVEKKATEDEKWILGCINVNLADTNFSKFLDPNNLPEKMNEDIMDSLGLIIRNLEYHMLKDDNLCEFTVKSYFNVVLKKAKIRKNETTLEDIWNKYKDDFIKLYHEKLEEREEYRKKWPDYYKNDK